MLMRDGRGKRASRQSGWGMVLEQISFLEILVGLTFKAGKRDSYLY